MRPLFIFFLTILSLTGYSQNQIFFSAGATDLSISNTWGPDLSFGYGRQLSKKFSLEVENGYSYVSTFPSKYEPSESGVGLHPNVDEYIRSLSLVEVLTLSWKNVSLFSLNANLNYRIIDLKKLSIGIGVGIGPVFRNVSHTYIQDSQWVGDQLEDYTIATNNIMSWDFTALGKIHVVEQIMENTFLRLEGNLRLSISQQYPSAPSEYIGIKLGIVQHF